MDYIKAREIIQNYRIIFNKTIDQELKDALEKAEEALLIQSIEQTNITYISPLEMDSSNKK